MRRLGRKQGRGWARNLVRGQLCSGLETASVLAVAGMPLFLSPAA